MAAGCRDHGGSKIGPFPAVLEQKKAAVLDHKFEALSGHRGIPTEPFFPVLELEGARTPHQRSNPGAVPFHNLAHKVTHPHGLLKVMLFTQKRVKARNFLRVRNNSDIEALAEFARVGICSKSGGRYRNPPKPTRQKVALLSMRNSRRLFQAS
jgi:hypothetical protein